MLAEIEHRPPPSAFTVIDAMALRSASYPPSRKGALMQPVDRIAIARFAYHFQAETALKTLSQAGFDTARLSVVGRGYRTEKNGVGFHKAGGQVRIWGNYGAFWGGLCGLSTGGVFLTSPSTGPVVALGALAALMRRTVDGIMSSGALSAALCVLGIPKDSVLECEETLKADGFLVFVHGSGAETTRAQSILAALKPTRLKVPEGVIAPTDRPAVVHVAA